MNVFSSQNLSKVLTADLGTGPHTKIESTKLELINIKIFKLKLRIHKLFTQIETG